MGWIHSGAMRARDVANLVRPFVDDGDEAAMKSRELILSLLDQSASPFSRDHFTPGHITATAVVLSQDRRRFLLVHHRRLDRWLLPGGHIEPEDRAVWETARREAIEETGVEICDPSRPLLVGLDVHGIPPRAREPFHLHHDLVFRFVAASDRLGASREVREVCWARVTEFEAYDLPVSIRRSVLRAMWSYESNGNGRRPPR
jgi:8-oxo-dGTP pyrophosphatase MutT (NUDIX family)